MQAWVNNVDIAKWAPEWAATDEKWILVDEALGQAGNEFTLTDNPVAMEWMVHKVEEKFEFFLTHRMLGGRRLPNRLC
jgi:hypothetical protein